MPDRRRGPNRSRNRGRAAFADERAVSPVVGKALEASIVVLYVAFLSATLYGGVVPEYRTAAGAEVGERVLAQSAARVQQAVPPDARAVESRTAVSLPRTIRGRAYAVRVVNRTLVLDHPRDGVGGRVALALPEIVDSVRGNWSSRDPAFVVVRSHGDDLAVRLESSGRRDSGRVGTSGGDG
ncbi:MULTISPECIES: hypothetical protein [Halorussus]|uniref:DUF7266 family protein n=1 Tax=Halorussus TaxID=1070314 RepID=UPI000E21B228|nr:MULTISPECIES: hypothetical protein [Halorussus]NHN57682.1 hypothetical protein [Halorussus sp. JP-T4]